MLVQLYIISLIFLRHIQVYMLVVGWEGGITVEFHFVFSNNYLETYLSICLEMYQVECTFLAFPMSILSGSIVNVTDAQKLNINDGYKVW